MHDALEVLSAHQERAVLRTGDLVLKVAADPSQLDVEVEAMALASAGGVPVPAVRWRQPEVLAMSRIGGRPLGAVGSIDDAPVAAWEAAGSMARRLHGLAVPPWVGWGADDFLAHADACSRWLVDTGVVPIDVVDRVRAMAEPVSAPFVPVFTHGDLQPAHVFVDGPEVVGLIDWSDAGQGDPRFDLAVLTVGFTERLDDVLVGYGDPSADRDVVRGYWAIRRLGGVRWMLEHGFDASGDIDALRMMAAGAPGYV